MLELFASDRVYPPEIVAAMSTAFDSVCRSVTAQVSGNDDVRRQLTLIILRHVDGGELDPARLAELAFNDLAGVVGGSLDSDEVWFGGTRGTLISSMALCCPRNGGADHPAETESDGFIERIKDFGMVEQARQVRKVFAVGRWRVGREVAVRVLSAGHWTPPFRARGCGQPSAGRFEVLPAALLAPSRKGGAARRPRCLRSQPPVRRSTHQKFA